jgi:hypothetical protein
MKTPAHHFISLIQSMFGGMRRAAAAICIITLFVATGTVAQAKQPLKTRVTSGTAVGGNVTRIYDDQGHWIGEQWTGRQGTALYTGNTTSAGYQYFVGLDDAGKLYGAGAEVFTAANGDTITVTFTWVLDTTLPMAEQVATGEYLVTGGTGRFAGATGHGTFEARYNAAGEVVVDSQGVITY